MQNKYYVREIRSPIEHAKLCEVYYNGSEFMVLMKVRKKIYTLPLRCFIHELTRDLPSGALNLILTQNT